MAEVLTTQELGDRLGVSRRKIQDWVSAGCPRETAKASGPGRPANIFALAAVLDWLSSQPGRAHLAERGITPAPAPAASPPADADHVEGLLTRTRQAERVAFGRWAQSVRSSGATAAEQGALQRSWRELAETARRLEREVPEIQAIRGRYVEADAAGAVFSRAVASMWAHLDQVGLHVAERVVEMARSTEPLDPGEIRSLVDEEMDRARGLVAGALERLTQTPPG